MIDIDSLGPSPAVSWRDENGRFMAGHPGFKPRGAISSRRWYAEALAEELADLQVPSRVRRLGLARLWRLVVALNALSGRLDYLDA